MSRAGRRWLAPRRWVIDHNEAQVRTAERRTTAELAGAAVESAAAGRLGITTAAAAAAARGVASLPVLRDVTIWQDITPPATGDHGAVIRLGDLALVLLGPAGAGMTPDCMAAVLSAAAERAIRDDR